MFKFMKLKCKICGKKYHHLGSHIFHGHQMTAREYKSEYELPYKMALISNEIYLKRKKLLKKTVINILKILKNMERNINLGKDIPVSVGSANMRER